MIYLRLVKKAMLRYVQDVRIVRGMGRSYVILYYEVMLYYIKSGWWGVNHKVRGSRWAMRIKSEILMKLQKKDVCKLANKKKKG